MTRPEAGFQRFLEARRADLRRIAARTSGECTVEDLSTEAWLIAVDIERRRGLPVDFLNADDQQQVLGWLHQKLVRYAEKTVRFAVKLDKDWDNEDAESAAQALARLLTAPEQFDPLVRLQAEEDRFHPVALVRHSYSEAAAYVILLTRFEWDLEELAEHLCAARETVRHKVVHSGVRMTMQPSLFDRVEVIPVDFVPTVAKRWLRSGRFEEVEPSQADWLADGCRARNAW